VFLLTSICRRLSVARVRVDLERRRDGIELHIAKITFESVRHSFWAT
jgi:hypothetical protein